jgi:hypothetical protein
MEEIRPGIFRYDGELTNPKSSPLVLVHPWWRGYKDIKNRVGGDYIEELNKVLANSKNSPVINFQAISADSKEDLKKEILESFDLINLQRRSTKGVYCIPTGYDGPAPTYTTWKSVVEFIKQFADEVRFGGGYFFKGCHELGCASITNHKFESQGLKVNVLEECCFGVY